MQFTWNINKFTNDSSTKLTISYKSLRILTISHAIHLKYTQFYKRFVHDINNFVSQITWKIHDFKSNWRIYAQFKNINNFKWFDNDINNLQNSNNFTYNSPRILTISHAIYLKYTQFYAKLTTIRRRFLQFVSQFTCKIHDFTSNWLKKWTISHAIYLKL